MAEYDDDEIGELEDGDPKIRGSENILNLSNVLDEFLQIQVKSFLYIYLTIRKPKTFRLKKSRSL